jgi:hypothetical protein
MRALGAHRLPRSINLNDAHYRLAREVKHDFFAATSFYDGPGGTRVVAKFGRTGEFGTVLAGPLSDAVAGIPRGSGSPFAGGTKLGSDDDLGDLSDLLG